jgi:hypothetical protein
MSKRRPTLGRLQVAWVDPTRADGSISPQRSAMPSSPRPPCCVSSASSTGSWTTDAATSRRSSAGHRGRSAGTPLHPAGARMPAVARRTKGQAPTGCCLKNRQRGAGTSRLHHLGHARALAHIADMHREAGLQENMPASARPRRQDRMNLLVRRWSTGSTFRSARGPIVAQTPRTTTDATRRSTASRPEKALQMGVFVVARCRPSSPSTRPVTREVAGPNYQQVTQRQQAIKTRSVR